MAQQSIFEQQCETAHIKNTSYSANVLKYILLMMCVTLDHMGRTTGEETVPCSAKRKTINEGITLNQRRVKDLSGVS